MCRARQSMLAQACLTCAPPARHGEGPLQTPLSCRRARHQSAMRTRWWPGTPHMQGAQQCLRSRLRPICTCGRCSALRERSLRAVQYFCTRPCMTSNKCLFPGLGTPHLQAALSCRGTLAQVSLLGLRRLQLLLHLCQALLMVAHLAVQLAQLTIAFSLQSVGEGSTSWSQAESHESQTGVMCSSSRLLSGCMRAAQPSVTPVSVSLHMLCGTVQSVWARIEGVRVFGSTRHRARKNCMLVLQICNEPTAGVQRASAACAPPPCHQLAQKAADPVCSQPVGRRHSICRSAQHGCASCLLVPPIWIVCWHSGL